MLKGKKEGNQLQNKITVPTGLERKKKKWFSSPRRILAYRVVATKFRVRQYGD